MVSFPYMIHDSKHNANAMIARCLYWGYHLMAWIQGYYQQDGHGEFALATLTFVPCTSRSVGKLKGVGQLAIAKMNELIIHTISDLQLHVYHRGKVPIRGFNRIYAMARQALPGNPPSSFEDYRKAKNPYHSRYGEGWLVKLKYSTAMSKFICITNLPYLTKKSLSQ